MAAGVPIVASDLPSIREVLTDGDNALLVPPDDPDALASAIRRLLVNPGLADRLRAHRLRAGGRLHLGCAGCPYNRSSRTPRRCSHLAMSGRRRRRMNSLTATRWHLTLWSVLMRVLYLGSTDLPQPKARAIQIVHTCHALARAGADVTLIAGRRGHIGEGAALHGYGLRPHPRLRLIRVPIARIPPTAPPRILAWFTRVWQASYLTGLATVLPRELATRRPDVIFVRDLRTARLAAGPARAIGARLLFEVHGLPSFEVAQRAGRRHPAEQRGRAAAGTRTGCLRPRRLDRHDHRVCPPTFDREYGVQPRACADRRRRHDGPAVGIARPSASVRQRSTTLVSCIRGRALGWWWTLPPGCQRLAS